MEQITKADLKAALASIAGLPQRNLKRYKGVPLDQLTSITIPDEHLVSGKYVKEHLKLSQSLFNAYLVREIDVLESSPTEGLR